MNQEFENFSLLSMKRSSLKTSCLSTLIRVSAIDSMTSVLHLNLLQRADLDTSLENAVKHHLRLLHGPLSNKVKDPEKFAGECSEFGGRFLDKHAAEHIMAWKCTEKFFREQKEYQEIIKQKQNNTAKNT